ncbi:hypothetical protein ACJX0J_032922, partial [Zea mays]
EEEVNKKTDLELLPLGSMTLEYLLFTFIGILFEDSTLIEMRSSMNLLTSNIRTRNHNGQNNLEIIRLTVECRSHKDQYWSQIATFAATVSASFICDRYNRFDMTPEQIIIILFRGPLATKIV